jgi:hypothetical protein
MYSRKMDGKKNMKRNIIAVLFGVILITSIFCGCQSSQVKKNYQAIFESDVVDLVNYTLETKKNKTDVVQVTINGRIENIVDRTINVKITADFYDINNKLLRESTITIRGLQKKGAPGSSTSFPPPYLSYNGKDVAFVDHIKLRADEIT